MERRQDEGGSYIRTERRYDGMGGVWQVTNPYRPGESVEWTKTSYDGVSRVVEVETPDATNPESGQVGYSYDANGNLLTKTDARGVVTTFNPYDGLDRPTRKSYNDGTSVVDY
jgi:YD repeat-containing protein